MENRLWSFLLLADLLVTAGWALAAEHPELKAFPAPEEGMERFVIVLTDQDDEADFKIELLAGKQMLTDGVNQVRLATTIEPRSLSGWGYTYYQVTGSSLTMSTLMAVPEESKPVMRFVAGTPLVIAYNSRLPIVVYAPQGIEVRYRIWSAAELTSSAEPG